MDKAELGEITGRLDQVIDLLKTIAKPIPKIRQLLELFATIAGILGIISIIDLIIAKLTGG